MSGMRWEGHIARMEEGKSTGKRPLERTKNKCGTILK
jgi:hypothetical protein